MTVSRNLNVTTYPHWPCTPSDFQNLRRRIVEFQDSDQHVEPLSSPENCESHSQLLPASCSTRFDKVGHCPKGCLLRTLDEMMTAEAAAI